MHVISNDSQPKFSISMRYVLRILVIIITFIVDNGSSASWDIIVIVLILDYLFFGKQNCIANFVQNGQENIPIIFGRMQENISTLKINYFEDQ